MARALHSEQVDPSLKKQKQTDAEWLASLPLLRKISRQAQQEEDDRIFAATLAGVTLNREPDERRGLAMLLNDRDDDEDDKEDARTAGQISLKKPTSPGKEDSSSSNGGSEKVTGANDDDDGDFSEAVSDRWTSFDWMGKESF